MRHISYSTYSPCEICGEESYADIKWSLHFPISILSIVLGLSIWTWTLWASIHFSTAESYKGLINLFLYLHLCFIALQFYRIHVCWLLLQGIKISFTNVIPHSRYKLIWNHFFQVIVSDLLADMKEYRFTGDDSVFCV